MSQINTHLNHIATQIRRSSLQMITEAGSGHPGGALSAADLMVALYFGQTMQYRPEQPDWEDRDRFILSAGHLSAALYATLAMAQVIPARTLAMFRQFSSQLQGHPHRGSLPGIETTTGSLAQGFSVAVGMAMGFKLQHRLNHVYCLMGDGEQAEGQVWEAAAVAAKFNLVNLICLIDRNGMEENGPTDKVMPQGNLARRYAELGWRVQEIDGHNFDQILAALYAARTGAGDPQMIVANTIMGKGVGFMETDGYQWHGKALSDAQLKTALEDLGPQS
jgi:transketolase